MFNNNLKVKQTTTDITYIAMAVSAITVCSWISVPLTVPVTLQLFAIFASVGLLGLKRGLYSVLIYILLGTIGLPVFSNFNGGIGALLGSTGGYIFSFIFSALIEGIIIKKFGNRVFSLVIAMVAGLLICYVFGTLWFMYVYTKKSGTVGILSILTWCVFPFIIPDAVKIVLAVLAVRKFSKFVK